MKIEKVIHSSSDDSFYLDFWPLVSKIWKLKFQVTPVLLHFGNKEVSSEYGEVIKMPILDGVPLNTQCQISRYWIPVTEQDTVWMTSDIDMLPISKKYFIDNIKDFSEECFINLNTSKDEKKPHILYPCCYNIAKGSMFTKILKLPSKWEDFVATNFWQNNTHEYTPNGLGKMCYHWGADEMWSSKMINQYEDQGSVLPLSREFHQAHNRIDRLDWKWDPKGIVNENYYDCHCIRPYSKYASSINSIVNNILKNV